MNLVLTTEIVILRNRHVYLTSPARKAGERLSMEGKASAAADYKPIVFFLNFLRISLWLDQTLVFF